MSLSNNTLAVMALCNEYCQAIQSVASGEIAGDEDTSARDVFVGTMLRLLPRIYIAANDIPESIDDTDACVADALDEDTYDALRSAIEELLGADDTYLEVFHQDMKYSDTPIAASIAEGLCDIFQSTYNYLQTVRADATDPVVDAATEALRADFVQYWSGILCNVLRALNALRAN